MLIVIAEVSNVFSVLIVFLVFCIMVVFILRLQGDGMTMTSVHYSQRAPAGPLPVIRVFNPFAFSLRARDCILDDVFCVVSSQVAWALKPLWGVDVARMHHAISAGRPWNVLRDELFIEDGNNGFLDDDAACLCRGTLQRYSKCADLELHVSPTGNVDLGRPPRARYPLVVVLINLSESDSEDNQVGAMIIVIHIKDDICTATSCVIAQYLKMTNGLLSDLKQLYVPDDDDEVQSDTESTSTSTGTMCLICRTLPASRALLPCRHVCSCSRCFEHLDKCPMCRSYIQTYFCIRDESNAVDESESDALTTADRVVEGRDWNRRIQRWNEWLNRTLGFT